jgi:hypothetical protein
MSKIADDDYESGPFCRHWTDPDYCDKVCKTCGHPCPRHYSPESPDACEKCDCMGWVEDDD